MQTQPKKVCSQIGLCTFDGTRGIRFLFSCLSTFKGYLILIRGDLCFFFFSMDIKTMVDDAEEKSPGSLRDSGCSLCEMAVVWIQNQLRQNMTQDRILDYANQVKQIL